MMEKGMASRIRVALVCAIAGLGLLLRDVHADEARGFRVGPESLDVLLGEHVFSSWNGGDPDKVLKPGAKILFFGEAQGCPFASTATRGGPVRTNATAIAPEQLLELTGLHAGTSGKRRSWRPSGDTPICEPDARGRVAQSFVEVNANDAAGGIALYTQTGPEKDGRPGFFGPFGKKGQSGNGANPHIEGTFVAFRQAWWSADALHPWASKDGEVAIRSRQSVASAQTGAPGSAAGRAQVKQQIVVSFINRACVKEAREAKRLCQIQYLFNTAVFRSGIKDWTKVPWFQNAGLFGDPAQGGMPVVHGPIPPRGKPAIDGKTGATLYRSEGAPSQHELFADRQFDVRLSFAQFKSALRMAVGSRAGNPGDKLSEADMVHGFGSGWDDPSQWVLLNASVGQEVFNAAPTRAAGIGGTVTEIEVGRAQ